jgi:hypothetical protein
MKIRFWILQVLGVIGLLLAALMTPFVSQVAVVMAIWVGTVVLAVIRGSLDGVRASAVCALVVGFAAFFGIEWAVNGLLWGGVGGVVAASAGLGRGDVGKKAGPGR